ncbi:MAG: prepilin-type N-terminal cleavage/methylation domain-containing protein [Agathobacter sp.]|nr:prepilin-type N-terminal cleavage/methylation domain-containing protein [Agathobacter sp.]
MRNTNKRHQLNKRGFSLIEVLIAVGILLLIIVPLTMNMISSSQMNAKAKETAVASDMSTSLMEAMQSLDLSDVMVEVNGYATNEYGSDIQYLLTSDAFKGYKIDETFEVLTEDKITYTPVTKQEDVVQDYLVTSSVNTRNTGEAIRAYFTGQKSGNYAFVLKGVTSDSAKLDILVTMTPEASSNIVNTNSLDESEVESILQDKNRAGEVAQEFNRRNIAYIMQKGQGKSIPSVSAETYLKWMRRIVSVKIEQNPYTETTTITVTETYIADAPAIHNSLETDVDRTITIQAGTFSTNSTTEFAKGVYYSYYPLLDEGDYQRDHFEVENKNLLAVPCYFVALSNDKIENYHPSIKVTEVLGGDAIFGESTRTRICSNVENSLWTKKTDPNSLKLTVQSLGNATEKQTMYTLNINVYAHREDSFDDANNFTPREKDLLTNTNGSFIDRSESVDIDSDITTGLVTKPGVAQVIVPKLEYNEEMQGIKGVGVTFTGTHSAINAGTYTAYATPAKGYSWPDGTKTARPISWTIARRPLAEVTSNTGAVYTGKTIEGVTGTYVEWGEMSERSAINAGAYTVYATPDKNHCWKDDKTYGTRTIVWNLYTKQLTVEWGTRKWYFDGKKHSTTVTLSGMVNGETCTAILSGNEIVAVGTKDVYIVGLSNKNYSIPKSSEKATLEIMAASSAEYTPSQNLNFTYDGQTHTCLNMSTLKGVSISGTYRAKNAGNYTCYLKPMVGYTWANGTTDTISIRWTIAKRPLGISFGRNEWVYDGLVHSTTITLSNIVSGDTVHVTLNNNYIQNVGTQRVTVNQPDNPNYSIVSAYTTLKVTRAPKATVMSKNYTYDGNNRAGVYGSYITITGTQSATNVRVVGDKIVGYTAYAKPLPNYCWADNRGTEERAFTWYIYPLYDAWYSSGNSIYTGSQMQFVWGANYDVLSGSEYATNIGQYTCVIKPKANHAWRNYSAPTIGAAPIASKTITYYINDTAVYLPELTQTELTYNGETQIAPIEWEFLASFASVEGDLQAENVGTYSITLKLNHIGYTWKDGSRDPVTYTWKIVPKEVTLTNNSNSWTYDGAEKIGTVTVGNICTGDTCVPTYSNNKHTNASTNSDNSYTFTVTKLSNSNYKLPSTTSFKMYIKPRTAELTWSTPRVWNYDGTQKTVTATISNQYGSGNNWNVNLTNNTRTDAGSQTVTAASLNTTNYVLPSTKPTTTMTINPIPSPITVSNGTWNFNCSTSAQTHKLAYTSNTKGTVTYSMVSQPTGNYFSISGTTLTAAAKTPANQYTLTIKATDAGNNNYTQVAKDFTITVTVSHASAEYGGTENVHTRCSVCKTTLSGNGSHSYSSEIIRYADCVTDEITRYTCACGFVYDAVTKTASGDHDFESTYTVDVSPGCYSKGSESQHCTRCSATQNSREIATLHSTGTYVGETYKANGSECWRYCLYACKEHYYWYNLGSHNYVSSGNSTATCAASGWTGRTACSRCGAVGSTGYAVAQKDHMMIYARASGSKHYYRCKWWNTCGTSSMQMHISTSDDGICDACGGSYDSAILAM